MTLAGFVLARITEDEARAREATPGPWRYNPLKEWFKEPDKLRAARAGLPVPGGEEFVAAVDFIARWNPARVLAECEAKRRIIVWHGDRNDCWFNSHGDPCDHLTALARPYADHPDYRPEWDPDAREHRR